MKYEVVYKVVGFIFIAFIIYVIEKAYTDFTGLDLGLSLLIGLAVYIGLGFLIVAIRDKFRKD